MKKKLSLCLILVLLLSFTVPAHAVSFQGNSKTQITGEPYLPDVKIEVVVPASGNVYINPLRLPVKVDGKVENKQIISDTFSIDNQSEVPLRVNVAVTGKIKRGSDMGLLMESSTTMTTDRKKAFMYFEIHAVSNTSNVSWDSGFDNDKHVIVRESERTKKGIVILDSADNARHFGAFRLTGDCIEEPKEPWNEKDGVEVNIVFTFSPLPIGTEIP